VKKSLTPMQTLFFWAIALLPILLLAETLAYVLTANSIPARIRGRLGHGSTEFHAAQRQKVTASWRHASLVAHLDGQGTGSGEADLMMFDPVLGWDFPPNVAYTAVDGTVCTHGRDGERRTCTAFPRTTVATYGDSFTYCDEVPDHQTWQTYLGMRLGENVLNFGVSGYGTDQAFLKFHGHGLPRAHTVMLCILPENINRVVNIYRLFYNYQDPLALTKPRFIADGNGFTLVPNPSADVGHLFKLTDPAYLEKLGRLDYWYQFDRKVPQLSFPYVASAIACRSYIFDQINLVTHRLSLAVAKPQYPFNLFNDPEAFGIMCHIVDLFVAAARERGAEPVVVLMPHKDYVNELLRFRVSRVARLVDYLKEKDYPYMDLIQAMADLNPGDAQLERWYKGHGTAEGNQVVADLMFRHLQAKEMVVTAR
jgi:hypothetical protein